MIAADILAAPKPVLTAFEHLNIAWLIGWSLAGSAF